MSEWLSAIGAGVANHLWQATAFAVVVWVVTLLLRKNAARVRYGLWVAASVKFLVPFSLLIGLGGMLPRPQHALVTMPVYSAVDEVGLPFSEVANVPMSDPTLATMRPSRRWGTQVTWPVVLAGVWVCGVVVVLGVWCGAWMKVRRTLRRAEPTEGGREAEILQRVEAAMGGKRRTPLLLSREWMEPGMFGIFRPVLIWPEGLSERLDDEHIEAILAHELMHARRRDNLTAALHMVVEAAFWFHPLAWWMGRRMVEERERACDEAVVEMGSRPGVYAESLLKACRFCVESPLVCVAGITGADLAARVRGIMTLRLKRLGAGGKLALAALAFAAIAGPVAFGVVRMIPMYGQVLKATGPLPSYEVVVIKPSNDPVQGADSEGEQTHYLVTAKLLIQFAYGIASGPGGAIDLNVVGGPDWINTDVFSVVGKMDSTEYEQEQKLGRGPRHERRQLMEQSLLADRFKLKMHVETRDEPVYALTVMKGLKLKPAASVTGGATVKLSPGSMTPEELKRGLIVRAKGRGFEMTVKGMTLDAFVDALAAQKETTGRQVVNQTGLTGAYDFTLVWGPEQSAAVDALQSDEAAEPPLFLAIQQQLGLKLADGKGPAEVVVVDHIEKPVFDSAVSTALKSFEDAARTEYREILAHPASSPADDTRARLLPVAQEANPTRDDKTITNGAPGDLAGGQRQVLHGAYKTWLEQDVRWIITAEEAEAFRHLINPEERDRFIEQFWQGRNPTPGAVDNAYRDAIYTRIAYANEHFASGQPGWMTDRGHIYIVYGKPDHILTQPGEGKETWYYRHIIGIGDNVALKFVDASGNGDYRLVGPWPRGVFAVPAAFQGGPASEPRAPGAGAQTPNPLKRRLTDLAVAGQAAGAAPSPSQTAPTATPGSAPAFEVASVRQAAPAGSQATSGRGTTGAGVVTVTSDRASYRDITLKSLLMRAYGLKPFQISGPAWMDSERYDVVATIPEGTSKDEVPVMLQHLLAERFRMTLHSETKEQSGYVLGIGKDGPKLMPAKNHNSAPSADPDAARRPASLSFTMGGSSTVMKINGATMPAFADFLSRTLGRPVIDSTELAGDFDIVLSMSMGVIMPGAQATGADGSPVESDSSMASLFTAVHDLGLTLSSDKVPLQCFVVDKAEKIPTEN